MFLFSGTSHKTLAQKIAQEYGFTFGKCEIKKFSCNETYVKLEDDVRGQDCTIFQTIAKNVNDEFMEVFLLADALCRHDAASVSLIMPHMGYARQDRRAVIGEPISGKLIARLIVASGIRHVTTFDLHSDQMEGFFDVPVDNLHSYPLFADYFAKRVGKDMVVVAPDAGAAKMVRRLATLLEAPIAILNKVRHAHHHSEHTHLVGDVKGKTAIIFDDMIDTAGTICGACDTLFREGAKEVYSAATHGIFSGPAVERLNACLAKEIVVTDTVPMDEHVLPKVKVLSVVPLLGKVL